MSCSSSSADLYRNVADSLYPEMSCLIVEISLDVRLDEGLLADTAAAAAVEGDDAACFFSAAVKSPPPVEKINRCWSELITSTLG